MTDKPIKDLTPEEREAFLQELKEKATPEQWESFTQFAQLVTEAAAWWNSDDVKAARSAAAETLETLREGAQTAAYIFTGLREFLPVLLEEMEKDGEAATMTASEFIESGKYDEIIERAAARLEKETGEATTITADEVKAALPQLSSIIPQKHLIPNNKLANSLTKEILNAGEFNLKVGGKGANEIKTRCILSYEGDNIKLTSRQPFTEYDRNVADAVTSLYEYGDESHIVTAATVYRAMVHATETETPSPQQIGAVTRSLDKMRFVRVQIDCSEELTRRKLSLNGAQVTGGKIDTYLLALEAIEVTAGGQRVKAYKVIKTPILYDYSRLTGQVITVPAALLDVRDKTGAKVANTERRIAIKSYLMRRISVMKGKNGKNQSRNILFETLYNEVCDGEPTEKEQRNIRDYIPQVLDYWKRSGFIKGYADLTQGRKKTGVEIYI